MRRNITVDKALMYASEMLSFLIIRAVHETKIAEEALVLFIHLFRKEETFFYSGRTWVSFQDGFITPLRATTSLAGLSHSTPFSSRSLPH